MKQWAQRVRGAIGIGLTWAAAWAPIGAITGWLIAMVFKFPLGAVTVNYALMFGVLGLIGGAIFSAILSLREGQRRFNELSFPRFVAWGAIGGLLLGGLAITAGLIGAGLTTLGAVVVVTSTLLGAGSAAGTLAIARSAQSRALLQDGRDDARAGLTGARARFFGKAE